MSSLCPGTLFSFPGFNKKSTPVPPQTTSEQLSKRYRREPFNGRPWPQTSPVAGVYDVGFSSTKMILFNNRKKKQSKLRGNNDPKSEGRLSPDPNRHYRASSPVSRDLHQNCYNSMSPYYTEPKLIPWINYSERPPPTYEDGKFVNPKRHTSCCVPTDPLAFRVGVNNDRRPYSRASLPPTFRSSPMLNHPDLKRGEKEYIGSIARIYSAQQMIKLKQKQYNQLLTLEMEKGYHTPEEYNQYKKFIELGRRRQYARPSRAMSAPPDRWTRSFEESLYDDDEKEQITKKDVSPRCKSPVNSKSKHAVRGQSSQSGKSRARPSTRDTTRSKTPPKTESFKPEPEDDKASKPSPATRQAEQREESSDTSESDQNYSDKNIHREGYDRPLSRLGHIPEDSKSQKFEQESTSNSETETKRQESSVHKSSTEESETQPTSEADTMTKSDQVKEESGKSDGNTSTDDTYRMSTDNTTTLSTDRDKTKSDTDTETAPEPLTADDKKTETLAENKPGDSDSYTDDFEKDTSELESSKKPGPQSQEKVVSFMKDTDSNSSSEDQLPAKRKDSLSDEENPSSRRDPDKLEY